MIEIQLTISGPWIPLVRAMTLFDLSINEAQRILNAGFSGIRVKYPDSEGVAFEAYKYAAPDSPSSKRFAWRSGTMAAPAFADL